MRQSYSAPRLYARSPLDLSREVMSRLLRLASDTIINRYRSRRDARTATRGSVA